MSNRSSDVTIKKIATGYLVTTDQGSYDTRVEAAFNSWDEVITYVNGNLPKMYITKFDKETGEYVATEAN